MPADLNNKIHKIKFTFTRADEEKFGKAAQSASQQQTVKKNPCMVSVNKVKKHLLEDVEYEVKIIKAFTKNKIEYCTMIFVDSPDEIFEYVSYSDIEFQ